MRYQVEIDQVTSGEYNRLLGLFEDANIYQSWSYGAIRWGEKNLSHLVLKEAGDVVGLAQLRIVRMPLINAGIAYLRWGPSCHLRGKELNREVLSGMAQALHDEYVERRRLLLRILPNAFVGSERAAAFHTAFAAFRTEPVTPVNSYRTFVLDLTPPLSDLRKQLDPKWRNKLNGAEKNHLRIAEGNGPAEYRVLTKIYKEMWERKRFETSVDIDEFGLIQEDLPEAHRMRVFICYEGDLPVASVVCAAMGDTGIYLLGATSDAGLQSKGAYLLQWAAILWLKERGFRYYDLGGIDPERNPGVYSFKRGLSGKDVSHLNSYVSCDNAIGAALVRAADVLRSRPWRGGRSRDGEGRNSVDTQSEKAKRSSQPLL